METILTIWYDSFSTIVNMPTRYGEFFASALAEELRAQKARKQVTDDEIAAATGIHRISVGRYLNGERAIPIMVFADICDFLQIPPAQIINAAEKQARDAIKENLNIK